MPHLNHHNSWGMEHHLLYHTHCVGLDEPFSKAGYQNSAHPVQSTDSLEEKSPPDVVAKGKINILKTEHTEQHYKITKCLQKSNFKRNIPCNQGALFIRKLWSFSNFRLGWPMLLSRSRKPLFKWSGQERMMQVSAARMMGRGIQVSLKECIGNISIGCLEWNSKHKIKIRYLNSTPQKG